MEWNVVEPGAGELVDEVCVRCGAGSDLWAQPLTRDAEHYCCPACAQGDECACAIAFRKAEEAVPR